MGCVGFESGLQHTKDVRIVSIAAIILRLLSCPGRQTDAIQIQIQIFISLHTKAVKVITIYECIVLIMNKNKNGVTEG